MPAAVSAVCAVALHLAFPLTGAWWTIPFALAGLFAVWTRVPPLTAAALGYGAGLVYFTLSFSWFGETAGRLLGPFGFIIDLGPAAGEAGAFAATAAIASLAARRCAPALAPAIAAAAFVGAEWVRSSGFLGVPFGQLGLALVDSPLRPLAAYAGGYGLALAAALPAAYGAAAVGAPGLRRPFVALTVAIALATGGAWLGWPARHLAPATIRVAAIQGNIRQEIKSTAAARILAVERYSAMTAGLKAFRPAFVLWPETVILTDMWADLPAQRAFGALAGAIQSELVVGTLVRDPASGALGNASVVFWPDGRIAETMIKRQLVPFAEWLPGPEWLRSLPFADEIGRFTSGTGPHIDPISHVGILICWESVFGDVSLDVVRAGADFLAVATDDAWFGHSAGPAQHAQATTLRAVESGRWVLRAAATGYSGIVGPDGDWRIRSGLETQEVVTGLIGRPVGAPYVRLGPVPIGLGLVLFALGGLAVPRRRSP